jgi:hypothetical protein
LLFTAASHAAAQYKVSGEVVEVGTGAPISGVEVRLNAGGDQEDRVAMTTDGGRFEFELENAGAYPMTFARQGYVAPQSAGFGSRVSLTATVNPAHPARALRVILARPVGISGVVLDELTRQPVQHQTLWILRPMLAGWRMAMMAAGGIVTTDSQGRFLRTGMPPGRYMVRVSPPEFRILRQLPEKDLSAPAEDYADVTFPGGGENGAGDPVDIPSGATKDLGKLFVKRVASARLQVSLPADACAEGEKADLDIETPGALNTRMETVACAKPFWIGGFRPGEYQLQAWVRKSDGATTRAYAPLTIRGGDPTPRVKLAAVPAADVDGRVAVAEGGASPAFADVRIHLKSLLRQQSSDREAACDSAGHFHFSGVPGSSASFEVRGLPPAYYTKSIRYDGREMDGAGFALSPTATAHSLEVVLDDKPASLFGSVVRNQQPVEQPFIVMLRWPRTGQPLSVTGDGDGKFQFTKLPPGEYRALAVSAEDRLAIHEPAILERALSQSQKVQLGPNASRGISLEVVELKQ